MIYFASNGSVRCLKVISHPQLQSHLRFVWKKCNTLNNSIMPQEIPFQDSNNALKEMGQEMLVATIHLEIDFNSYLQSSTEGLCFFSYPNFFLRKVREYDDLLRHRANTGTWGTADHRIGEVWGVFETLGNCEIQPRWWFEICSIFTPIWGRFPFWLIFFKGVETTN